MFLLSSSLHKFDLFKINDNPYQKLSHLPKRFAIRIVTYLAISCRFFIGANTTTQYKQLDFSVT